MAVRKQYTALNAVTLGFHEAGHGVMGVYFGQPIRLMYIQNGLTDAEKRIMLRNSSGVASEADQVAGATLVSNASIMDPPPDSFTRFMAEIMVAVAAGAAERLAPVFISGETRNTDDTAFYRPDGMSHGAIFDLQQGLAIANQMFGGQIARSNISLLSFARGFIVPAEQIVNHFQPAIEAIAKELIEEKYISGVHAHELICKHAPKDSEMPGCLDSGGLIENLIRILQEPTDPEIQKIIESHG